MEEGKERSQPMNERGERNEYESRGERDPEERAGQYAQADSEGGEVGER